jgi:large subunit ribosomal protein L13
MTMELERITTHTKPVDRVPEWHVIDASEDRLGRLASKIAALLMGKHRADYSRHQLAGDFVIVVNASQVGLSGDKRAKKIYYRHTGYIGHLRSRTLDEMLTKFPERVIEQAVKGMLPRNRLGRQMLRRLKVYNTATHPHEAQVNAGTGKAKQAPEAPATTPARRRGGAAAAEAPEAAIVVAEAEATEAQDAAAAPEEAAAATPRRRRAPAAAKAEEPAAETEEPAADEAGGAEVEDTGNETASDAEEGAAAEDADDKGDSSR